MARCASCSTEVRDSVTKCPKCGADLATSGTASLVATVATGFVSIEAAALPQSSGPTIANTVTSRINSVSVVEEDGRFLPGALVAGRYRILGLLGKGGMGEVYRATDLALAQSVALKFLNSEACGNQRWLERFHAEVRIARQISHPNVCRVYDIGEADGVPFLSMEFVDGDDIATLLVGIGRLPHDKAIETARKICAGLAAAHDKGVIHRDLKPQNLMMTKRGEILITDFGLAAVADTLHGPEARNGTPAYMAPEQLRGSEVTAKSDIYALGLVLYELFTGKKPFEARTIPELISLQESQQLSSMKSHAADIDPSVEGIIKRCLHPDPGMRPASALAVAAALPGGDPLAAALAAGETPSPELLAASGKREAVPLKHTLPVLIALLAALIVFPFLVHKFYSLSYSPLDMPVEVLEQKARDHAAALGYTDRPADWDYDFISNSGFVDWINRNWKQDKDWYKLFHAEPIMLVVHRESPRLLKALPDGATNEQRPPQTIPGMWKLEVDTLGRLRRFAAVPPPFEGAAPGASVSPPVIPFDPQPVFQAAGFELSKFTEVAPQWTPAMGFDSRRAWKGRHPALDQLDVTVQIAAWRGRVVDVQMIWPWTKPVRSESEARPVSAIVNMVLGDLMALSGTLFCIWLARRNLLLGRGDRRGAWRLAILFFVLNMLAAPARMHFVPDGSSWDLLVHRVSIASFGAGLVWLLYIALEPVMRSRWPHAIITWSRAISGQFSDPQLGSHILYGCGIGVLVAAVFVVSNVISFQTGGKPSTVSLDTAIGARNWIAVAAEHASGALTSAMTILFLIFGVRQVARKDWIAAAIVGLVLAFRGGVNFNGDPLFVIPMMLSIYSGLILAVMRVGMVAATVAVFTANTLTSNPATLDPLIWYNPPAYLRLVMLAAIAWYGFVQSRGDATKNEIPG